MRAFQSANPQRGSVSDPKAEYSRRLEFYLRIAAAKNRIHIQIGNLKLAVVAAGLIVAWLSLGRKAFISEWLWAPIAAYLILSWIHQRIIRARTRAETAAGIYQRGIARIEDRWAGTGQTGDRFRDREHVYADDLDLFGRGCLFELLSTARLPMGENQLANWLKSPGTRAAILDRQKLVAELRDKLDLQRDLAVMGEELRTRLNPESLVGWAEGQREMPGATGHFAAIFLALALLASVAWSIAYLNYWPVLCVLVVEIIFRRALHHRAHHVNEGVSCNAEGLLFSPTSCSGWSAKHFRRAPAIIYRHSQARRRACLAHHSPACANRILDRRPSQLDRPSCWNSRSCIQFRLHS